MRAMETETETQAQAQAQAQVPKAITDAELEAVAPPNWRASKLWCRPISLTKKDALCVLFLENTPSGQSGQILWINKGLARNFYFPRKEAIFATASNVAKHATLIEVGKLPFFDGARLKGWLC